MVSSDSSSDDDESSEEEEIDDVEEEEEEIEEISTEGARANGLVSSNRGQSGGQSGVPAAVASNPLSLKTEMNKVDVIVDGRPVAGMYQVVHHRIETISTTNAVVPRAVIDVEQQVRIFSSKSEVIKIAV